MTEQEIKYTYSTEYIIIMAISLIILIPLTFYTLHTFKEIEQLRNPTAIDNVKWLYSCPDYVDDYYNCNATRFMNMTGKYCGTQLTCENKYEIIK